MYRNVVCSVFLNIDKSDKFTDNPEFQMVFSVLSFNFHTFVKDNSQRVISKIKKIMNIRNVVLVICCISVIISCSQSSKNKNSGGKDLSSTGTDVTHTEDFNSFLEDFNHKPTFQRQRILFPIEATLLDPSDYGMQTIKENIDYQDWLLLDFTYDSTYLTRQMDKYKQRIVIYNDSALIEQRGVDNGIFANYLFTKKEGKWFLKSFIDVSY